jgi:hypothetical protein
LDFNPKKIRRLNAEFRQQGVEKRIGRDSKNRIDNAADFAETTKELIKTNPVRALVRLILAPRRLAEELDLKDLESIVRSAIDSRLRMARSRDDNPDQQTLFDMNGTKNDQGS